jgi:hypothetical protein
MIRDLEPAPLYLDPGTGEPRPTCMISDALLAQCDLQGHIEKTRFGTLSELLIVHPSRFDELTHGGLPQVSWRQLCFSHGGSYV